MKFNIITTQSQIYDSFLTTGLIARGIAKKIIQVNLFNLYDYATDAHKSIDDTPYGGGVGMVLRVDVVDQAIASVNRAIKSIKKKNKAKVILLTPQGKKFDQAVANKLAKEKSLIIISGRFEGYDERIRDLVEMEISLGDYVLTSGDLPAMVLIDAISRQVPGFIEKSKSIEEESFSANDLLEYPQYTRPEIYKTKKVPEILLSGDHEKVAEWRKEEALKRTRKKRPDLLKDLTK